MFYFYCSSAIKLLTSVVIFYFRVYALGGIFKVPGTFAKVPRSLCPGEPLYWSPDLCFVLGVDPCLDKGDLRFGQSTLALTRVTSILVVNPCLDKGDLRFVNPCLDKGDLRFGQSTLALTRVTSVLVVNPFLDKGDLRFGQSTLALTRVTSTLVVAMSENPDEPLDNVPLVDRYRSVGQPKTLMVDPEDVVSTLTYQDVERFKSLSYFPTHWECYVPGPEDGGLSMAPHFSLCLYEDMFRAGVRFPLHPSICEILDFYNVCPAQLAPNAWKVIIGFVTLASSMSLPVSAAVFSKMHKIQRHPGCSGVWYFTSDKTTRLLLECSDDNRNCSAYALLSHGPVSFKVLVNERNLIAAGLSHRCTPEHGDAKIEEEGSSSTSRGVAGTGLCGFDTHRGRRPAVGGPSSITRKEASGSAGSDIPVRFFPSWNVSEDDTITNRVTAIEMMSHVMHPRDVAAATDATFQGLADDEYALLAQQLFTHKGLIAKVNYGPRRVMELATEVAQGEGRVKHLEGEVTDLQGRLASVELEREEFRKENEALKLSAKEVADAVEEAQIDFYLDGFDDYKQMACTYFPAIDFGRLVPCPPASASGPPTTDMETAEGSPSPMFGVPSPRYEFPTEVFKLVSTLNHSADPVRAVQLGDNLLRFSW
ncbi:hypothetical protein PHJA_001848500 [Phtheirospermum japonicum]|uniref:Transposase (putative) gypsy type domain-containing protein n=1 Tax=Phtheirospermum japonicum TaxID=374723 RepID=A0A830CLF9_9LAMI|nr:hypothetical protein PHJA_001848500 [Phtheirospermum japonicum]